LIVGLGNPGPEYARTRHNIGFIVVEELARRRGLESWTKRRDARVALDRDGRMAIVEPLAYMNLSGPPALGVATFYKVPPVRILVVVDDLDLPFGRLRLRADGSSGGHNGLKSLIEVFGQAFPRLRVGIGRDRENPEAIAHVLGAFTSDENVALPGVVDRCIAGIESWLDEGIATAMNRVNVRPSKRNEGDEPKDG
jgi:PTH1 family peptidyl-tRNA hydrolase